jgi:hypothetical protein
VTMTTLQAWIVTAIFFFCVFCVGKYLQMKEKQDRMVKEVETRLDAPRSERRSGRDRRQSASPSPANALAQRR